MIYTRQGIRCERCFCLDEAPRTRHDIRREREGRIFNALSLGPRTLIELSYAAFGDAIAEHRRYVSYFLRDHRDVVERVSPSTYTLRKHAVEAAE